MKKRMFFCAAVLCAASMLFGFDSAKTADEVLSDMQQSIADAEGVTSSIGMNADVVLNLVEGEDSFPLSLTFDSNFDLTASYDPLALSMEGTASYDGLLGAQEITMRIIGVTDESGQFTTYVYTAAGEEDGEWEYTAADLGNLNIPELLAASASIDYSTLGMNFQLDPDSYEVNGSECYRLYTVMDASSFQTMLDTVSEMSDMDLSSDSNVEMVMSILDGIKINLEYYVDAATSLPVSYHIDLNDSDVSALNQYAAMALGQLAEGASAEIELNNLSADMTMSYGPVAEITVPQEALDNAQAQEEVNVSDLAAALSEE